jgi:hypothetical protein
MEDVNLDELRRELFLLEEREALLSAQRRHLHHQIDFGFATEGTREREREVSDERRELHRRIDELREILQVDQGTTLSGADDSIDGP